VGQVEEEKGEDEEFGKERVDDIISGRRVPSNGAARPRKKTTRRGHREKKL